MLLTWLIPNQLSEEQFDDVIQQMNDLLQDLSPGARKITPSYLRLVCSRGARILLAREDVPPEHPETAPVIFGMATLLPEFTIARISARIEDVVVHPDHRGKGISRRIFERLFEEAGAMGITQLDLTSHPSREAANALYLKLGFERRETNVYRRRL